MTDPYRPGRPDDATYWRGFGWLALIVTIGVAILWWVLA